MPRSAWSGSIPDRGVKMPPYSSSLLGSAGKFSSPARAEGPYVLPKHLACLCDPSPDPLQPAETTDGGGWMLSLLLGDCCSPLVLVSRLRVEVWFCPFLYYMSLKKLFSPVWITPALDIAVLPQGTISGCSLEAMPRSFLVLANLTLSSAALLPEGKLWEQHPRSPVDCSLLCASAGALTAPGKADHPLMLNPLAGMVQVQLLCVCHTKPRSSFGAWAGLSGEPWHGDHSLQAEPPALLLPLVTLRTHPDGNCSPSWKSCPLCCGTPAPKQLQVLGQCSRPFPQGK